MYQKTYELLIFDKILCWKRWYVNKCLHRKGAPAEINCLTGKGYWCERGDWVYKLK